MTEHIKTLRKYDRWSDELFFRRYDLQLFAAEDEGRTEEPTEKKLREAREKGQVAKTVELPQAIVVIFGFMVILVLGSWIYDIIARLTKYYLSSFSRLSMTERSLYREFIAVTYESGKILLPIFVASMVAAVLGNIVQVGFQFSAHPLKFDLTKIKFDPATIMKRVFFSKQIAMNLFKSLFKVAAIGFVAYLIIMADLDDHFENARPLNRTGNEGDYDDGVQDNHLVGGAAPGALDTGLFFPEARVHRFVEDDQGRDEGGVEGDDRRPVHHGRGSGRCSGRICCGR